MGGRASVDAVGPHGGPVIVTDGGRLEISVFEAGVPPRFRLYFYENNHKAAAPPASAVDIETVRPHGQRQPFAMRRGADFLESTSVIPEPHEFRVLVTMGDGARRQTYEACFTEAGHRHAAAHEGGQGHVHGMVDPEITATARGLWAVKWSFVVLFVTSLFQLGVVLATRSVALMADTIHNFGDAATAIPLGLAFLFARRPPSRRFTYGFGRVEDLAGLAVVLTITASAVVAATIAIQRLLHPQAVAHLGAIIAASIIGFAGNEGVAIFRIRVGKQIGSAALVADGYHARTDGWTSLAVLLGAVGVYLGFPLADPIIGLAISVAILGVVWASAKMVFARILDGVEPDVIDQIGAIAQAVDGVVRVSGTRARWLGHRLRAEVNVSVAPELTVVAGQRIAEAVEAQLRGQLQFLSGAVVQVAPNTAAGESAPVGSQPLEVAHG